MTAVDSTAPESASPEPLTVPPFAVVSGAQVQQALQGREAQIMDLVEATYKLHGAGDSVTARPRGSSRCPPRSAARHRWTA
jgi:ornithine cyclodeaminase